MGRTATEDAIAAFLKAEPPLQEQVLKLGQYLVQLTNIVNGLSINVAHLQAQVEELVGDGE